MFYVYVNVFKDFFCIFSITTLWCSMVYHTRRHVLYHTCTYYKLSSWSWSLAYKTCTCRRQKIL